MSPTPFSPLRLQSHWVSPTIFATTPESHWIQPTPFSPHRPGSRWVFTTPFSPLRLQSHWVSPTLFATTPESHWVLPTPFSPQRPESHWITHTLFTTAPIKSLGLTLTLLTTTPRKLLGLTHTLFTTTPRKSLGFSHIVFTTLRKVIVFRVSLSAGYAYFTSEAGNLRVSQIFKRTFLTCKIAGMVPAEFFLRCLQSKSFMGPKIQCRVYKSPPDEPIPHPRTAFR